MFQLTVVRGSGCFRNVGREILERVSAEDFTLAARSARFIYYFVVGLFGSG